MIEALKSLFGMGPKIDFSLLKKNGAQIIDVRTPGEFKTGHIQGSINIPLQSLSISLSKIMKDKPIITYCASGIRSASAKNILKSAGFTEVHNGGGWSRLKGKL